MIRLFTSTNCGKCVALKNALRELGLDSEETSIDTSDGLAECCMLAGGATSLPILVIDGRVVKDTEQWLRDQSKAEESCTSDELNS